MIFKKKKTELNGIACYQFDSKMGFWGIPNIKIKLDYADVTHDADGNRNFKSLIESPEKPILCYGGSHTWGGGVEQSLRYTDLLEAESGKPVVNIGHCSLGLDQICLAIINSSAKYNPEIIVIEQYPWAVHRILNNYVNGYVRPYFYLDSKKILKVKTVPFLAKYKIFRRLIGSYYAFRKEFREFCLGLNIKNEYNPLTDPIFLYWKTRQYDYMYELAEQILLVMCEYCRKNKIKLLFALGAIKQQFEVPSKSELIDYALPKKRLIELLESQGIEYVDISSYLLQAHSEKDPVIFPDGHINVKGHRIFAEVIHKTLLDKEWI